MLGTPERLMIMTTHNEAQQKMLLDNQMREPKAPLGIFDLPCGVVTAEGELLTEVKVREITGHEEDMLTAKNIGGGKKITQLIANCLERLGPITEKTALMHAARGMTIGDRVFLMMAIRRVTLGDDFPFEKACEHCEAKSIYMVDLSTLETVKMKDPMKRVHDVTLPSGKTARFHVMTGKDEEDLAKVPVQDSLSMALLVRLDLVDDKPANLDTVKSLGMKDRHAMREAFEAVEGGMETAVDLDCPDCGESFKAELEVGQTGFFFPSRVRKNSKPSTSSS